MILIGYFLVTLSFFITLNHCEKQMGPDPWDYEVLSTTGDTVQDSDIPPDLRPATKKLLSQDTGLGISDIFFKRILAIIMKGSQTQKHDDGSVEVTLQMKFDPERWNTLDKYLKSNTAINEAVLRRSMGYIEEAIYKPTILEKVIMAWSDYVQIYLVEYKMHIRWTFGLLGAISGLIWLRNHLSHRHVLLIIFITLYMYEAFISYKEAEQQELERFLSALNKCQWQFWSSSCEVPPPDLLLFMKHMNPLKIAIRMFTTVISEPMISMSSVIKTMVNSITDGFWFPFDKIVYGILMLSFNVLLIIMLILIMFNYLLNIPFSLSFFGLNVGVKQRKRNLFSDTNNHQSQQQPIDNTDRISGATLNRLLDVFSHAITNTRNSDNRTNLQLTDPIEVPKIRRSASTGRLPTFEFERNNVLSLESNQQKTKRQNTAFQREPQNGSGDAR